MKCPVCDDTLREIQKHGVNVDICPGCKGVWLDRGELEKILEMASAEDAGRAPREDLSGSRRPVSEQPRPPRDRDEEDRYRERRDYDDRDYDRGYQKKKRRGSWLGEIFEGFGD